MKQTTEQQNTLREPERGVVDWVGWLRNTTTRVVVWRSGMQKRGG